MTRFVILLGLTLVTATASAEPTRLLGLPDIHAEQATFVYAGYIHIASTRGGVAWKLTSDQGFEIFPKFSPDGKQIAFSAEYKGTRQVYVMPSNGGILTSTFPMLDTESQWAVENEGTMPDIELIDRSEQIANSKNPSLETGVRCLLELLEENPPEMLELKATPDNFR